MEEEDISPDERASIGGRLALLAPPCEFSEVLNDIRIIAGDDPSLHKKLAAAAAQYNRDQMIPVKLPQAEYPSLLTIHGDLSSGNFLCPRLHTSFHYDHLNQTVDDVKKLAPDDANGGSISWESWRLQLETAVTEYTSEHYPGGCASVYAPFSNEGGRLVACIESHFCKHQSTGRWRSEWTVSLPENPTAEQIAVHGVLKVQTHLYEEGNVQLISSKELDFTLPGSSPEEFAKECVHHIKEADIDYQIAVGENFKTMSNTTFKALRRQLPLTRSKIDWNKIITYQIGSELSRPP